MKTSGSLNIINRCYLSKFKSKQIHGDPELCKDLHKYVLINQSINAMKSVLPISCHDDVRTSPAPVVEPNWELLLSEARFILSHIIVTSSKLNPAAPSFYPQACCSYFRKDCEDILFFQQ